MMKQLKTVVIQLTVTGFAIVMALLAAEFGLEESFGALGMALASSKLPTFGTRHALIPARSAARVAAQVALGAGSTIAVISVRAKKSVNLSNKLV